MKKKMLFKSSTNNNSLKTCEIKKLKRSTYFDEDSLKEIRKDLELLTDEEIKKNKKIIKDNSRIILKSLTSERLIKFNKERTLMFS